MVAIRLRRAGSKKRPYFRIVVTDSRAARDSSFIEILGHYNPRTRPALVDIQQERVDYWISKGAQPSDSVRTLIKRHLTPMVPKVITRTGTEGVQTTTGTEGIQTKTGTEGVHTTVDNPRPATVPTVIPATAAAEAQ